ncbi:hypothetical protein [uncultured Clostridium sp.]|uniref:hypothetical protein n=1 Tax=uncultured Clostridium sp. TaxID=59620 RepID=UPI0026037E20|nr:hypothetical protein [uncultured Clostridium sp.]
MVNREVDLHWYKRNNIADLVEEIRSLILNNVVIQIKPSKSSLRSIIKYSSSKFNEYKKEEVIDIILKSLNEEITDYIIAKQFISGTYTQKNGYSTHYYFYRDKENAFLVKKDNSEIEVYELIK